MSSQQTTWYLRKPDGSEYGPITTSDMQRWAAQCRIVAGNGVSTDRETWIKVEDIPELEMDWIAYRDNGSEYGPFNIAATRELIEHGVLTGETVLTHKTTHKSVTVEQVLNEEDLFEEPEDESSEEEGEGELVLSEEALKEEEFYTKVEHADKEESPENDDEVAEIEPDDVVDAADESSGSSEQEANVTVAEESEIEQDPQGISADAEISELKRQQEEQQAKIKKTEAELIELRKEIKGAQQESESAIAALTSERDELKSALKLMQKECDSLRVKYDKDVSEKSAGLSELKAELEEAVNLRSETESKLAELESKLEDAVQSQMQAESKLSKLESERQSAEQLSLQSVAELRKQTAFMKKNTATLQNELEKSRMLVAKRGRQLIAIIVVVVVVVALAVLVSNPGCRRPNEKEAERVAEPTVESVKTPPAVDASPVESDNSRRSFSDIKKHSRKVSTVKDDVVKAPVPVQSAGFSWPKFMIEGVKAVPAGRACTVYFDSGVFSSLVTPSAAALKQLDQIAAVLRPQMDKMKVIVEGYTDDKPLRNTSVYNGNDALALARAEVVRKILVTKGHLPALAVTARHSGGRKPPYPNDSDLNRRRNRTVVLRLVRK